MPIEAIDDTDIESVSETPVTRPVVPQVPLSADKYAVTILPISEVFSDPNFNCRGEIVPYDVRDLVESIKQRGLDFPITVVPWINDGYKWKTVAGHRRHLAMKVLKKTEIPANIRPDLDETGQRLLNLNENVCRQDLNILQEANALKWFASQGWSEDLMAAKTDQSRGWVQVRLLLLRLPEDIQKVAAAGLLTQMQIRNLYTLKTPAAQYEAVRKIKDARERGDSIDIAPKKPPKPHDKKERSVSEMTELQEYIQEQIGNNVATRVLGWCRGFVSDYEIHCDIKNAFPETHYRIPKELTDNL